MFYVLLYFALKRSDVSNVILVFEHIFPFIVNIVLILLMGHALYWSSMIELIGKINSNVHPRETSLKM